MLTSIFYNLKKLWFLFTNVIYDSMCWCCHLAKEELKSNRIQRRVHELLSKAATSKPKHACLNQRELHFVFFRKPNSFQESKDRAGHVSGMHFEKTVLQGNFCLSIFTLLLWSKNLTTWAIMWSIILWTIVNCHNFLYKCRYVHYWAFLKCLIYAIHEALLNTSTFKSIVAYSCAKIIYDCWLFNQILQVLALANRLLLVLENLKI